MRTADSLWDSVLTCFRSYVWVHEHVIHAVEFIDLTEFIAIQR